MKILSYKVGALYSNCYLLVDEETNAAAIIDPGGISHELDIAIANLDVKYIILTHCHFDHIRRASRYRQLTGAKVVVYVDDAVGLSDESINGISSFGANIRIDLDADILVSDGEFIELGNLKIKVMHTPGHTIGSCCYICENTIFSGDTLFRNNYGRTDLPTGSIDMLKASMKKLAALEGNYIVLPGHDDETTLNYERMNNELMR